MGRWLYLWFGNVLVPLVAAILHDESFVLLTQLVAKRRRLTLLRVAIPCRALIAAHGDLTAIYGLVVGRLPVEQFLLVILILPEGHLPPFLLLSLFLGLGQFYRLVAPACELILRLVLILDGLVETGVAGGSLDIDGMQAAHVGLVHGDPILKGVAFGTLEDVVILDLGVVEPVSEVLPAVVHEVILPRGHLGGEFLGLAVEPGSIRHEVLLVEGVRLVEGQLVVVHSINLLPPTHKHFATVPQFYWMDSNLNASSYYRANPFYQQGYIPDAALKNRRPPQQHGELPQGEEFFQPTNKKHFQRVGYYSTIADQKIIHSEDPQPPSPAKDKDYFRSLNINDIQGAATNTLISKAVKNRIKAQEELNRRAQQQREAQSYQKMKMLERQESDRQRMQALSILNSHSQPNYHEKVKRMRTEEQEKMNKQMGRQHQMRQGAIENDRPVQKDAIQTYREELQQADREIRELQLQLSQVKTQKEKAQQDHNQHERNYPISPNHDYTRNIAPVTNERSDQYHSSQSNDPQEGRNENPEQYYAHSLINKLQLSQEQMQYLANERQRQQISPHEHHPNAGEGQYTQRQPNEYRRVQPRDYSPQKGSSSVPLSGRQHREVHRRFNPTFLSYGSPSINLAGKNIVGY